MEIVNGARSDNLKCVDWERRVIVKLITEIRGERSCYTLVFTMHWSSVTLPELRQSVTEWTDTL